LGRRYSEKLIPNLTTLSFSIDLSVMELREITEPRELEQAFKVIVELRETLSFSDFLAIYETAREADQYRLVAACEQESYVGVMGYRLLSDFVHGKHLYIDDLVVTKENRSRGIGAQMLEHAEKIAKALGCRGLRLCTGVQNEAGKRFYERNGWNPRALAYKKML